MRRQHPDAPLYLDCQIGDFRVLEYINHGGFSLTFEAENVRTAQRVGLKVLDMNAGPEAHAEFYNEGDLLFLALRRTNVIDILAAGEGEMEFTTVTGRTKKIEVPYIAMQLADGSLADLIVNRNEMAIRERLMIFRQATKGIHQLHLSNIAHRDVKCSNVLLVIRRSSAEAFITDLGRSVIAQNAGRYDASAYAAGRGDPSYLAPELIWLQGERDFEAWRRIDIYGLGSILFELVVGVGISTFVFTNPLSLQKTIDRIPVNERKDNFRANHSALIAKYRPAFELFESQLPRSIAKESRQLLEQLCNPNPSLRIPKPGYGGQKGHPASLEWLLKRIDILCLRAKIAETPDRSRAKKGNG